MTVRRLILLLSLVALPLGAATRDAMVELSTLTPEQKRLLAEVREVEDELLVIRGLPPAERYRRGRRLERDLKHLLDQVTGTRYENHALFWLADWSMTYEQDHARVANLVQRVLASSNPARKGASRALYVRALLAQGRSAEAEQMAVELVTEIPEFAPILRLVEFTQQVGNPAPVVRGRNLTGGADNPAATRDEPWLLYAFVALGDPTQRFGIDRTLEELGREEYRDRVQLVVVAFDGDPLLVMDTMRAVPRGGEAELLWANPNEGGDAETWRQAWNLPELPVTALLGPDRSIMAVNPTPRRLRPLAGLDAEDGDESGESVRPGLWRGKRGHSTNRR